MKLYYDNPKPESVIQANRWEAKLNNRLSAVLWGCVFVMAAAVPVFAGDISKSPEPSTFLLIGGGLAAVFGFRAYRKRKQ